MLKAMQAWESMMDKTAIARYFSGIFNQLAVEVLDTGEKFTVHHKEDHFELTEGLSEVADFHVEIMSENIENMKAHGADGTINANESFRIMSVLFTPLTKASLKNPILSQPFLRKLSGIEDHIVVYLEHPTTDEFVSHTLLYFNNQWLVVPGVHGTPKRTFRLNPSQTIEYQRKFFTAMKKDSLSGWQTFKKWYFEWRKEVSTQP
jgi:hypothetical protein